jgi:acid phosphatase family membrane protein YuiD
MSSSNFLTIFQNDVLVMATITWAIAQLAKPFIGYLITREFDWKMFFSAGGMPSSHTTLVSSVMVGVGLMVGWASPEFAVAASLAAVVIYDSAGVRRQAGIHAQTINVLVQEVLQGHPISDTQLREVLGHTPIEVFAGILWGTIATYSMWYFWK